MRRASPRGVSLRNRPCYPLSRGYSLTLLAAVLLVFFLTLPCFFASAAPLPFVLTHKDIIMTVGHGLLDHVDARQLVSLL